jgi:hypothetical protein
LSGWIKFEKDLLTDPRVLRVAKSLSSRFALSESLGSNQCFESGNDHALPAVTLVCGALARMWVLADTHIGSDNVLPLGCIELNDILGIPGFCELLPEDWLVVIDDDHVQLPEFHEHNGTEAKKKAVTQKRVARHRDKLKPNGVTHRNAQALPDQDQTKTIKRESAKASKRVPKDFTPDLDYASTLIPDIDAAAEAQKFRDWEFKTPRSDWPAVWRTWIGNCKDRGQYSRKASEKWT